MKINLILIQGLFCLFAAGSSLVLTGQNQGIYISEGSTVFFSKDSKTSGTKGNVQIAKGGTLINEGTLEVDENVINDGTIQTSVSESGNALDYGTIAVNGETINNGVVAVGIEREALMAVRQKINLLSHNNSATNAPQEFDPNRKQQNVKKFDVELDVKGEKLLERDFGVEIGADYKNNKVIVDWLVSNDRRTKFYIVESKSPSESVWKQEKKTSHVGNSKHAYYSANITPTSKLPLIYRVKLIDESGEWYISNGIMVEEK